MTTSAVQEHIEVDTPEVPCLAVTNAPSAITPPLPHLTTSEGQEHTEMDPPNAPSLTTSNVSSAITLFKGRFKQDRYKRRKLHRTQNLIRKFRNMDVKATKPHYRTVQRAPSSEVVQTPVTALLCIGKSDDGSMFRKRKPTVFPVSYPPSPPKPRKLGGQRSVAAVGSASPRPGGEDITAIDIDILNNNNDNIDNNNNNNNNNNRIEFQSSMR